jgi:hypothetical protein
MYAWHCACVGHENKEKKCLTRGRLILRLWLGVHQAVQIIVKTLQRTHKYESLQILLGNASKSSNLQLRKRETLGRTSIDSVGEHSCHLCTTSALDVYRPQCPALKKKMGRGKKNGHCNPTQSLEGGKKKAGCSFFVICVDVKIEQISL